MTSHHPIGVKEDGHLVGRRDLARLDQRELVEKVLWVLDDPHDLSCDPRLVPRAADVEVKLRGHAGGDGHVVGSGAGKRPATSDSSDGRPKGSGGGFANGGRTCRRVPGTVTVAFSITPRCPNRSRHEAIVAVVAGPAWWRRSRGPARLPKPTYGDSGVFVDTPTPTVVTASPPP